MNNVQQRLQIFREWFIGLDVGSLKGNLQEIYSAAHTEGAQELELSANIFETRLYDSSMGWGRFWKWFYKIASGVLRKDLLKAKVSCTVLKTHVFFQKQQQTVMQKVESYGSYLNKRSKGDPFDEGEAAAMRHAIADWNDATRPFVKLVRSKSNSKLENLFKKHLGPNQNAPNLSFYNTQSYDRLGGIQRIIDAEARRNAALPFSALAQISKGENLNKEQSEDLDKWIVEINKGQGKIGIRKVHRLFSAIAEQWQSGSSEVSRLELELINRECKPFLQKDSKHMLWRDSLKSGEKILCNQREVVLGEQIGKKSNGDDHNIIYAIENDSDRVVVIGINEAILQLKQRIGEEHGWGIKTVGFVDVDKQGRCAIVERLYDPVDGYQWTSADNQIGQEDEEAAAPIMGWLKWLVQQNFSPTHMSPKYLMFDKQGQLKCLKVTLRGDFNFNAMVDFALACAKDNFRVYQYLMEGSGLYTHASSKFYKKIVENTLNADKTSIEDVGGMHKVTDPRLIERAKILAVEAAALKQRCLNKIQEDYESDKGSKLDKALNAKILSCYDEMCCAGTLWPSIDDHVVKKTIFEATPKLNKKGLEAATPRMRKKHVDHNLNLDSAINDPFYEEGVFDEDQIEQIKDKLRLTR